MLPAVMEKRAAPETPVVSTEETRDGPFGEVDLQEAP